RGARDEFELAGGAHVFRLFGRGSRRNGARFARSARRANLPAPAVGVRPAAAVFDAGAVDAVEAGTAVGRRVANAVVDRLRVDRRVGRGAARGERERGSEERRGSEEGTGKARKSAGSHSGSP